MTLNKTLPFAPLTLAAGFLLSMGVGCSDGGTSDGAGGSGATDTGGATNGTGGATGGAGGATGAAGGATGAAGGATGAAGGATGGAGGATGAAGGATAGTGGAAELTGDTLLGVDGKFWPFRANNEDDTGSSKYWLTSSTDACPGEGHSIVEEYTGKGEAGQLYTVQFEIRGALALRCYENGTPSGTTPNPAGINEALYLGGEPTAGSMINTISLTVSPDVAGATANTYYLNGMPSDSGMCDEQITYDVQYKGTFQMMGDSTVTLAFNSPDCQALPNCGADAASCAPRTIDTEGIEVRASAPQPVSDAFFPESGQVDLYPQWLIFDIQEITEE
jgi:hypothetical protein